MLIIKFQKHERKLSSRKKLLLLAIRGYTTLRGQRLRLRHFYIRFLQWILTTKQQTQTNGRYANITYKLFNAAADLLYQRNQK